jgi:hypothetical protein
MFKGATKLDVAKPTSYILHPQLTSLDNCNLFINKFLICSHEMLPISLHHLAPMLVKTNQIIC